MKKLFLLFLSALTAAMLFASPSLAYTLPASTVVHARSALLYSLDTETIVYEKDIDETMYPASLQKMMVALLVIEREPNLDRTLTVSSNAVNELLGTGAAVANLKAGEEMTVRDLLYCLLLPSACDAANVLAETYGGSIAGFVDLMNEKAAALGMESTHFANAHGLHHDDQHTTARDILQLALAVSQSEELMTICSSTRHIIEPTNKNDRRVLVSTVWLQDKMTNYYYKYAKGIKTGYTESAGRCVVSTAEKDGSRYLCVVMGCAEKDEQGNRVRYEFVDSKALYEWAFSDLTKARLVELDKPVTEIRVELCSQKDFMQLVPAETLTAIVPKEAQSSVILEPVLNSQSVEAPINKGDVLGYAVVKCAGEELGQVDLVAAGSLERSELLAFWKGFKNVVTSPLFLILVAVVILLIVGFILLVIIQNRNRRRPRQVRSARERELRPEYRNPQDNPDDRRRR